MYDLQFQKLQGAVLIVTPSTIQQTSLQFASLMQQQHTVSCEKITGGPQQVIGMQAN